MQPLIFMKFKSFIEAEKSLIPVEIEVSLWPGLPQIQFIGRPDAHLKESAHRIKSAIKASGFQTPAHQQILVNLSPSYLKKSSRGLELAVALAILHRTEQMPDFPFNENDFFYGELDLMGQVYQPQGLDSVYQFKNSRVITGAGGIMLHHPFELFRLSSLSEYLSAKKIAPTSDDEIWQRPQQYTKFLFSRSQAQLIKILAHGEHSALLAGPSGSGKTTIGMASASFLNDVSESERWQLKARLAQFGVEQSFRPVIAPHSRTPLASLLGGGAKAHAGELAKAHRGCLILDELLEFPQELIEALRQPLESKKIRISRILGSEEYPMESLIIGTTNLCPCGDFVPGRSLKTSCRFSLKKCRSYSERLSGPIADRFEVCYFTSSPKVQEQTISGAEILAQLKTVQDWKVSSGLPLKVNSSLALSAFEELPDYEDWVSIHSRVGSQRRWLSQLRVARTLADLSLSKNIEPRHLQEAYQWTVMNQEHLRYWS